jgi:hypothetical protein
MGGRVYPELIERVLDGFSRRSRKRVISEELAPFGPAQRTAASENIRVCTLPLALRAGPPPQGGVR